MKKTIALIVAALMIVMICMPACAVSIQGKLGDNISWTVNDKGELIISGKGEMGTVDSEDGWMRCYDRVTSIIIKDGVTSISDHAFKDFYKVTSVSIPGSVKVIGAAAFGCSALKSVVIPQGVKEIKNSAFSGCINLKKITLPASVTKMGSNCLPFVMGLGDVFTKEYYEWHLKHVDYCIYVSKGSKAEKYAKENGYTYDNGKKKVLGIAAREMKTADSVIKKCIKKNMTEKQKAKALHDWIIKHAYYADTYNSKSTSQYTGSLLVHGYGTCGDYTAAYALLLSKVGIANTRIDSNKDTAHEWNLVRIDGKWYHVDTTWDDPGLVKKPVSGYEYSRYFMLTDAQMRKDHHWDESQFSADKKIFSWDVFYPEGSPKTTPTPTPKPTPKPVEVSTEISTISSKTKTGDCVTFGRYEQDGNPDNGKEPIEWIVLSVKKDKALMISKYALEKNKYDKSKGGKTWEKCSLRKWLNNDFKKAAFNKSEQKKIEKTKIKSLDGKNGNDTEDYVFILSWDELTKYLVSDNRQCQATQYAKKQGALTSVVNGNVWWWLRSPKGDDAYLVNSMGEEELQDQNKNSGFTVRPAIWIKLK